MSYPSVPCQPCTASMSVSCNPCTNACTDTYKSDCMVYTGSNILAGLSVIVTQNSSLNSALAAMVAYTYSITPSGVIDPSGWTIPNCLSIAPVYTNPNGLQHLIQDMCTSICSINTTVVTLNTATTTNTNSISTINTNLYKVKVSSTDTTPDYLLPNKIITDISSSVTITKINPGSNEQLSLSILPALGGTSWTNLTLTTPFYAGTDVPRYKKDVLGWVTLTGVVSSDTHMDSITPTLNTTIATLPIGFRPVASFLYTTTISCTMTGSDLTNIPSVQDNFGGGLLYILVLNIDISGAITVRNSPNNGIIFTTRNLRLNIQFPTI